MMGPASRDVRAASRVTLRTVAAHVGLSTTTVSHALSGRRPVSEQTCRQVRQAAQLLGYEAHRLARQNVTGRSDAVGVLCEKSLGPLSDAGLAALLDAVSQVLQSAGLDCLMLAGPGRGGVPLHERIVRDRHFDALLVLQTRSVDARIESLVRHHVPFVAVGRCRQPAAHVYPWLDLDEGGGAELAVGRLVDGAHRRIACVHLDPWLHATHAWCLGYRTAMQGCGLPVTPQMMLAAKRCAGDGYAAGVRLLAMRPRPSAVIVQHPQVGNGLMHALLDAGVDPCHELAVVVHEAWSSGRIDLPSPVARVRYEDLAAAAEWLGRRLVALVEGCTVAADHWLCRPSYWPADAMPDQPLG